jgi:PAS domain S-box-containing protein
MEKALISSDWAADKGQEEFRVIGIDGVTRNIRMTYGVSRGADKRPIAFLGAAQDITAEKESEKTLRESEEKFSKAFYGSAAPAFMTRPNDGCIIEVNDAAITTLGFRRDEVVGRTTAELKVWFSSEDRLRVLSELERKGVVSNEEVCLRAKDGRLIVGLFSAVVVEIKGEKVALSSILDITKRKAVEEELAASRLKMAAGMNLAHLGIWEYDVLVDQFTFDEGLCSLLGISSEEEGCRHMSWQEYLLEFVHPEDRETVTSTVKTNVESDFPDDFAQFTHRVVRRDGCTRTIMVRVIPIRDPDRKIVRTFGVNQDITEQTRYGSGS